MRTEEQVKPAIERLAAVLDKRPSSRPPAPSRPKWQPTSVKLRILQTACGDQAVQAERAGLAIDAAEWRELSQKIGRLA